MVFDFLSGIGENIAAAGGVQPGEPVINAVFRGRQLQQQQQAQQQLSQALGLGNLSNLPAAQQIDAFQQLRLQDRERAMQEALRNLGGFSSMGASAAPSSPPGTAPIPTSPLQQQILQAGITEALFPEAAPAARAAVNIAERQLEEQERIRTEQRAPELEGEKTTAREEAKLAVEREQKLPQAKASLQNTFNKHRIIVETIDELLPQIDSFTAGFGGSLLSVIPGTPASDLASNLNTVLANIGFEELSTMRQLSPGGGALGQVSERENTLLQALKGSVEQSQTPTQLKKNLKRVRDRLARGEENLVNEFRRSFKTDFDFEPLGGAGQPGADPGRVRTFRGGRFAD